MGDQDNAPAPTVESVQHELTAEREAHLSTKQELATEQAAHLATQESLAAVTAERDQAAEIIDGQQQTIDEQASRITDLQTTPLEFPVITVGKVKYAVEVKNFKYNDKDYTVKQLLTDANLQKELVKLGVGYLVKLED